MKGWKTYAGAAIVAIGAVLRYLGYDDIAEAIMVFGGSLGLVGIAHKAEKIKGALKLVPLLIAIPIIVGCAGQLPSVCDSKPDSVLCDIANRHGVRLETVGDIILVVNLRVIKQGVYTKHQAADALERMKMAYHAANFTAADLKALVLKYADDYPELILVMQYAGYFDAPTVLKSKDIEMLDWYVDQQLTYLK